MSFSNFTASRRALEQLSPSTRSTAVSQGHNPPDVADLHYFLSTYKGRGYSASRGASRGSISLGQWPNLLPASNVTGFSKLPLTLRMGAGNRQRHAGDRATNRECDESWDPSLHLLHFVCCGKREKRRKKKNIKNRGKNESTAVRGPRHVESGGALFLASPILRDWFLPANTGANSASNSRWPSRLAGYCLVTGRKPPFTAEPF